MRPELSREYVHYIAEKWTLTLFVETSNSSAIIVIIVYQYSVYIFVVSFLQMLVKL